jgi:AraC-like DNA-binding protein
MEQMTGVAAPVRRSGGLDGWNRIVGDAFTGCVVDAAAARFEGGLAARRIDDFTLVRIAAQPSRVQRWADRRPVLRSGTALLHLHIAGTGVNRQGGREVTVHAGEGALCDPDAFYAIDFLTPYQMFVMELPVDGILRRQPGFDLARAGGQAIDPGRSKLLLAFLGAAWDQVACLGEDAEWRSCVSRVATDLALQAIAPVVEAGPDHGLRRRVIGFIAEHLADPGLRTSAIAAALGVCPRSVQGVFEKMATTASAFILQQRLRLAAERLRAERGRTSITAIAYDCGFADSAYFSRCFHKHFGVSPRQFGMM